MSGNALTRRPGLPLILALILWALVAASPSSAIPLDVRVGFDGVAKSFVWTPVTVEMTNTSDEDIDGVLNVEQPDQNRVYLAQCVARVVLPAHSKKLYHTYVRLSDFGGQVIVTLTRGNGLFGMKRLNVDPFSKDDRLVVSVGPRTSRLNFLNNEQFPVPPRQSQQYGYSGGPADATIHVGSLSQKMLPDRPAGYDGVDVMVLADLTPSAVSSKSLKAIAMWVASGGTLVIPTGADYRRFQNEFYAELLPVDLVGTADLPGAAALGKLGGSLFPVGPVTVAKSTPKPGLGRIVAAEGGVPLIVDRPYGAGRVVFLAFDHLGPPFSNWNGQTEFWKNIVKQPVGVPMTPSVAASMDQNYFTSNRYNYNPSQSQGWSGLAGVVTQNPSVKAPSFNSIGVFLLLYLLMLVPVNYLVLKRMRRLELAWISTPAVVILFVFGAYAMGYTMKGGELRLLQATVIEGASGERFGRVVTEASLFSPARRAYDIEVADPASVCQVVPVEEKEQIPPAFIDEKSRIDRIPMAMWSSRTLESVSGIDLGGTLEANLTLKGNRLRGTVRNKTAFPLRHCRVVFGDESANLPDLPTGASANVDVSYRSYSGRGYSPTPGVGQFDDRLYSYAVSAAGGVNSPVLVAMPVMKTNVFGVLGCKTTQESAARCAFRLRYRIGGSFQIPDSMMTRTVTSASNINVEGSWNATGPQAGTLRLSAYNKGSCVVSYRMLVPPGGQVTTLVLSMNVSGGGPPGSGGSAARQVEVSVFKRSIGGWDIVTAAPTAKLTNASDYISPDGEVRVKLKYVGSGPASMTIDLTAEGKQQ